MFRKPLNLRYKSNSNLLDLHKKLQEAVLYSIDESIVDAENCRFNHPPRMRLLTDVNFDPNVSDRGKEARKTLLASSSLENFVANLISTLSIPEEDNFIEVLSTGDEKNLLSLLEWSAMLEDKSVSICVRQLCQAHAVVTRTEKALEAFKSFVLGMGNFSRVCVLEASVLIDFLSLKASNFEEISLLKVLTEFKTCHERYDAGFNRSLDYCVEFQNFINHMKKSLADERKKQLIIYHQVEIHFNLNGERRLPSAVGQYSIPSHFPKIHAIINSRLMKMMNVWIYIKNLPYEFYEFSFRQMGLFSIKGCPSLCLLSEMQFFGCDTLDSFSTDDVRSLVGHICGIEDIKYKPWSKIMTPFVLGMEAECIELMLKFENSLGLVYLGANEEINIGYGFELLSSYARIHFDSFNPLEILGVNCELFDEEVVAHISERRLILCAQMLSELWISVWQDRVTKKSIQELANVASEYHDKTNSSTGGAQKPLQNKIETMIRILKCLAKV